MIGYTVIKDTEHLLFVQAWQLYKKSFPSEERRQLHIQKKIMNHPLYHFGVITDSGQFVGLIFWWGFEDVRYIEHLAILPRLRGQGYGQCILKDFISAANIPVLLEVEQPVDNISRRRIDFYRRAGFVLNKHPYTHPPYKKGGKYVSLMLMTRPNAITGIELQRFLEKYHPVIHEYVLNSKETENKHTKRQQKVISQ